MIYHITPYMHGNIGKGINEHIKLLPADAWVCLRDQDTLLFPGAGKLIEDIVMTYGGVYALIGACTNRIGDESLIVGQSVTGKNVYKNVTYHVWLAQTRQSVDGISVHDAINEEGCLIDIPGMFMLFPKRVWEEVGGFAEKSIYFDRLFNKALRERGHNIGVALGLYVFHLYRWGSDNPKGDIEHLVKPMTEG